MTPLEYFGYRKRAGEVGIEIEVEGSNIFVNKMEHWKVIRDGSLRGKESAEYVLTSPVKRKEIPKVLKYIKNIWKENGCLINENSPRTSVHAHINVQDVSFSNIINYFCLYSIFEEALVKFCGTEREGNLFCLRLKDADSLIDALVYIIKKQNWKNLSTDTIRYASLNMAAIPKYGSMEFRAMRGTTDISLIQTWVYLLLRLKDQALNFNKASDIVSLLSQSGEEQFLYTILGKYADMIHFPNINRSIREGVRRIQEIAYTPIEEKKIEKNEINHIDEVHHLGVRF